MYTFGDFTVEGQEMRVSSSGSIAKGIITTGYVDAQIGQAGLAYNLSPKLQVGVQYVFLNDNYLGARAGLTTFGANYGLTKRTHLYAVVEQSSSGTGTGGTVSLPVGYSSPSATGTTNNSSLVAFGMYHTF
jgi:hypothetical protein